MKKVIVTVFIVIGGLSFRASAQAINKIYLTLDTASNTGKCPRYLKFKAVLFTDRHPGPVTLKWLNGSGSVIRTTTVTLSASGQDVANFELGVPTKTTGGVTVVSTASKPAQSNEVQYIVTCK